MPVSLTNPLSLKIFRLVSGGLLALTLLAPAAALAGTALSFPVTMSEAVVVTGTPRLAIDVGGVTRYASYASGSGTNTLTFTYNTQEGDVDLNGIAVSSPLDLNGGTLKDLSGNAVSPLTFTAPNTANVKIDHPSLAMDFIGNDYLVSGTHYASLASFIAATSASFSRASVGTYVESSGVLQTAAAGTPRIDYSPTTLASNGLLIEEARTNGVRNNTMTGAAVGVPGTLPTLWALTGTNGLSVAISGVGADSGINYVDVHFYGTTITSGAKGIQFNSGLACTAVPSGKNVISAYLKRQAGSSTNIAN